MSRHWKIFAAILLTLETLLQLPGTAADFAFNYGTQIWNVAEATKVFHSVSWFQAESWQRDYLFTDASGTPVDLTATNLVILYDVVPATNMQQTFIAVTGMVVNGTSGHARISLVPTNSNINTDLYYGIVSAVIYDGTNISAGKLLVLQSIEVKFSIDARYHAMHGPLTYSASGAVSSVTGTNGVTTDNSSGAIQASIHLPWFTNLFPLLTDPMFDQVDIGTNRQTAAAGAPLWNGSAWPESEPLFSIYANSLGEVLGSATFRYGLSIWRDFSTTKTNYMFVFSARTGAGYSEPLLVFRRTYQATVVTSNQLYYDMSGLHYDGTFDAARLSATQLVASAGIVTVGSSNLTEQKMSGWDVDVGGPTNSTVATLLLNVGGTVQVTKTSANWFSHACTGAVVTVAVRTTDWLTNEGSIVRLDVTAGTTLVAFASSISAIGEASSTNLTAAYTDRPTTYYLDHAAGDTNPWPIIQRRK